MEHANDACPKLQFSLHYVASSFSLFIYGIREIHVFFFEVFNNNFFFFFWWQEQFIYDLPARLGKCIKSGAYAEAVRFYTGAMPIFKVAFLFLKFSFIAGSICAIRFQMQTALTVFFIYCLK